MEKLNCIICNSLFNKTRPNKICCSDKCRKKKWRLNNKDHLNLYNKQNYNSEYQKKYKKEYRLKNPNVDKKYYNQNKNKILDKAKDYYNKNQEDKIIYQKDYYSKNSKKILKQMKEFRDNNKELISERKSISFQKHKENYREKRTNYELTRRKEDELYYLKHIVCARIRNFLRTSSLNKTSSTFNMIGCSPLELKEHLEKQFVKGMNWNNRKDWHIDHIKPLASATTEAELETLCHFSNLQPLYAIDNLRKGAKIE